MIRKSNSLVPPLEEALVYIARQRGSAFANTIRPVLYTNLEKGRLYHFIDGSEQDNSVLAYVCRVADNYEANHAYIVAVQQERNGVLWDGLYVQLQRWAYAYLKRMNFPANCTPKERQQHAQICATEAAINLLTAHFPYDTEFGRWAYVLLQNISRQHIDREWKILSKKEVEVDAWANWFNNIIDPDGEVDQELLTLRHDLDHAIAQLSSEARRQFIQMYYFEHLPFSEIATRLDRKEDTLYKLHHDAKANLRKILGEQNDIYG